MGILNGVKEQLAWGNLKYLGGYPGKVLPFVCALHKEGDNIVLYGGGTWKPIFSIPKDDILNLELVKGINKREDRIIVKIKYENMELDLQFSSGSIQLSYNKMISEIHKETIDPVQTVETKGNEENAIIEKKTSTDGSEKEYFEINFYNKEWFMWATLIFFAPVGIYLLWKHRRYSKNARIALSVFFGIIFLFAIKDINKNNIKNTNGVQEQTQEEVKKEEKPGNKYSNISLNEIKYQDGKVNISGSTDLPNNSKLTISFDVAGRSGKDTYIGVNKDSLVQDGKFIAELVPPNRQEFTLGKYVVEVLFTPKGQSQEIINLVGSDGENLTGNHVKKNDMLNFNVLRVNKQVNLQLNIKPENYPMIDSNSYSSNTPERAFAEYLNSWKNQDWNNMVNYTQITWRNSDKNPSKLLKNQYDFKTLLGAEIKDKKVNSDVSTDITAIVYYRFGNNVSAKTITARIIKETTSGELSTDGQWGVNPISAIREQ